MGTAIPRPRRAQVIRWRRLVGATVTALTSGVATHSALHATALSFSCRPSRATASVALFPRALRLGGTRRLDRLGPRSRLDANVALRATMEPGRLRVCVAPGTDATRHRGYFFVGYCFAQSHLSSRRCSASARAGGRSSVHCHGRSRGVSGVAVTKHSPMPYGSTTMPPGP